jgi:hypothetical protein
MVRSCCGVAILMSLGGGLGVSAPAPPGTSAPPDLCGVGLLDAGRGVLYLPGAAGGVEAVSLRGGKPLWESKEASSPVLASGGKVFALAPVAGKRNEMRVVVLDARTGKRLAPPATISFPGWVSVTPAHGRRFRRAARPVRGGMLLVWEASRFRDGGEPPPGPDPNARQAGGAVRVDGATGEVAVVKGYRPKKADFRADDGQLHRTVAGGWVFDVEERYPRGGSCEWLTRRVLKARSADGRRAWGRSIAGEVDLPPRP